LKWRGKIARAFLLVSVASPVEICWLLAQVFASVQLNVMEMPPLAAL
jgi:hypothetical protein